jgi:predicted amino acid racemase
VILVCDHLKAKDLSGSPKAVAFTDLSTFTLWQFANNLNKDVRVNILHAGSGTLWTDLEMATLGELGGATLVDGKK